MLFRKYGWSKTSYLFPFYRTETRHYNFDDYASKGSVVYPVKKYHRNMQALTSRQHEFGEQAAILDGEDVDVPVDMCVLFACLPAHSMPTSVCLVHEFLNKNHH